MKNYTITVNGNVYDVTVEENGNVATPASAPRRVATPVAPVAAAKPVASAGAGSVKVESGAAGKVFKIEKKVGDVVKQGDAILILEAMKMEIPAVAPADGTIASIDVAVGDTIEAGAVLATLN